MSLKSRLYSWATGRAEASVRPGISFFQLLQFMWQRGGWALVRGSLYRWRLGSCGGRFLLGRRTQVFFAGELHVGHNVAIGDYTYLSALSRDGVRFGNNVRIREYGWLQVSSSLSDLGAGIAIGDDTYIGPRCLFGAGGGIRIGRRVLMGAGVNILAENHVFADADRPISDQGIIRRGITIEDDVWVGNGVMILDGVTVGQGAVLGAGSIVTKDVQSFAIVAGNPARQIGRRVPGGRKEPPVAGTA